MPVCIRAERRFIATSQAPKQARDFCIDQLRRALSDIPAAQDVIGDAALVVSELMTNAVTAGATTISAQLAVHCTHLQVSITDDAAGQPHLQDADLLAAHGRGLQIVDSYALRWGADDQRVGKQVWAILPVPSEATAAMECNVYALV